MKDFIDQINEFNDILKYETHIFNSYYELNIEDENRSIKDSDALIVFTSSSSKNAIRNVTSKSIAKNKIIRNLFYR